MNWVRDIKQDIKREVIAIDGKTVRGMATKNHFKGTEAKAYNPFLPCLCVCRTAKMWRRFCVETRPQADRPSKTEARAAEQVA